MVGVTNRAKHVIIDQFDQKKKLQAQLKKAEVATKVAKGPKVLAEKAFGEAIIAKDKATAQVIIFEATLRVFSAEKELATQALLIEKVARVNAEQALVKTKKW